MDEQKDIEMEVKVKKTPSRIRMNVILPPIYLEAMNVIYDSKRVKKSHQVELGLKLYCKEHRDLLLEHGIDLWKREEN